MTKGTVEVMSYGRLGHLQGFSATRAIQRMFTHVPKSIQTHIHFSVTRNLKTEKCVSLLHITKRMKDDFTLYNFQIPKFILFLDPGIPGLIYGPECLKLTE